MKDTTAIRSTITGSPRQIAWALGIRTRRQEELAAWLEPQKRTLRSIDVTGFDPESIITKVAAQCAQLLNDHVEARYWIKTRHQECYQLLNAYFK